MKQRKILSHANLIVEVTDQLKSMFPPQPPLIKRQIAKCIEGDYLERSPDKPDFYQYKP